MDIDDAMQEAAIAVLHAADRWDPKRKLTKKFKGYVYDMVPWYFSSEIRRSTNWRCAHSSS